MDEQKPPKFCLGQIIAGSKFAGEIQKAFYSDGEWNYGIGENASTEPTEEDNKVLGYRIGQKFIKESDVKWKQNTLIMEWRKV